MVYAFYYRVPFHHANMPTYCGLQGYFSYISLKHILWVLVRTASTIHVLGKNKKSIIIFHLKFVSFYYSPKMHSILQRCVNVTFTKFQLMVCFCSRYLVALLESPGRFGCCNESASLLHCSQDLFSSFFI